MESLNIFGKFFKKKKPEENYLALTITPDQILACVWQLNQDNVQVIGFGQKSYQNLDHITHQAAVAIDTAGQKAKTDVSKTVFGLSSYWLADSSLKDETAKLLKNLESNLDLNSEAFVSLAAAINHFLKIEESITPQAVLVGAFSDSCEVHLIENNKIINTKISKSEANVPKIIQLVGELKETDRDLPSRIIIFGLNKQSKLDQELSKANWQKVFIHDPKIDVLDDDELARAVAYAQAADLLGYEPSLVPTQFAQEAKKPQPKKSSTIDEFGFIEGEDILEAQPKEENKLAPFIQEPEQKSEAASTSTLEESEIPEVHRPHVPEQYAIEMEPADFRGQKSLPDEIITVGWLPKILGIFKRRPSIKNLAVVLIILIILAASGAFVATQSLVSAKVIVKVKPQNIDSDFKAEVVLGSPDEDQLEVSGQEVSVREKGSQKAVATGSKTIGEYAKGQVTVFNWTPESKTFLDGTVIISINGLKFKLDSELEVASRSATIPGQNNTNVIAVEHGLESNIASGQEFTFQEFDQLLYSARNDQAFTGGSEKQVTVVSQEDLARLEKSLSDSLIEKSQAALQSKTASSKLHQEAITKKVIGKTFDKKVDEEASLINLDMEVEVVATVYSEEDLQKVLSKNANKSAPQNFEARSENIEITNISAKKTIDSISLSGKYRLGLVPKINEQELKEKIAGKSIKEARSVLKEKPEVGEVEIIFSPSLPILGSIPRNKAKIQFKVEAI